MLVFWFASNTNALLDTLIHLFYLIRLVCYCLFYVTIWIIFSLLHYILERSSRRFSLSRISPLFLTKSNRNFVLNSSEIFTLRYELLERKIDRYYFFYALSYAPNKIDGTIMNNYSLQPWIYCKKTQWRSSSLRGPGGNFLAPHPPHN